MQKAKRNLQTAAPRGHHPGGISEFRLHIGVHKTATTHLQAALALMSPHLGSLGIDYVPMAILQGKRIPDLRRRNWRTWLGGAALRQEFIAKLAPHRQGAGVVALSLEDWIGPSQDALAPVPYPAMERRLGLLAHSLSASTPVHLFLAIRSWDDFLPSAYATVLRFRPLEGGFDAVARRALAEPPDWAAFVRRLQKAAPRARLHVWRYEEYRQNAQRICSALCGQDIGPLPEIPDPGHTKTPTRAAILEAERLDPGLGMFARRDRVEALYARHAAAGGEKYMPFAPADRAALRAAYDRQCEAIFADARITRVV